MHESSTAGGGDEAPREDGATNGGTAREDVPTGGAPAADAPTGAAPSSEAEADGGATPPPADGGPAAPARPRPHRTPERSQAEQDEIFAALVAQFDDPVDLNNPNWPEIENLRAQKELKGGYKDGPDREADPGDHSDLAPQPRPRSGRPVLPAGGSGPRDFELAEDGDDDHFVPPEPPPLPTGDVTSRFAWLAVLGGPALLLIDAVVWQEVSGWPAWVGITAFLGGFVTLVARMKDRDDDEPEDPNHGAVV
ncbi:hypothetical protein [Streptomyces sp. Y1]|uniref:DUF308 domain-containing protein n=1 Tax=Streptomyces sp. Y1 TaxID=3238634 RepID=A0AB39TQF3_9ACTN